MMQSIDDYFGTLLFVTCHYSLLAQRLLNASFTSSNPVTIPCA